MMDTTEYKIMKDLAIAHFENMTSEERNLQCQLLYPTLTFNELSLDQKIELFQHRGYLQDNAHSKIIVYLVKRGCFWFAPGQLIASWKFEEYFTDKAIASYEQFGYIDRLELPRPGISIAPNGVVTTFEDEPIYPNKIIGSTNDHESHL